MNGTGEACWRMITRLTMNIAVPRTSVDNKDIIQIFLDYNLLKAHSTVPISASFVEFQAMVSSCNHQSKSKNVLILSLLYLSFEAC